MNDFTLLVPEFAVVGLAFGVLTADLFLHDRTKHFLAYVSVAGLGIIAAFSLIFLWNQDGSLYKGLLVIDGYSLFFKAFFLIIGVFAILGSVEYVRRNLDQRRVRPLAGIAGVSVWRQRFGAGYLHSENSLRAAVYRAFVQQSTNEFGNTGCA